LKRRENAETFIGETIEWYVFVACCKQFKLLFISVIANSLPFLCNARLLTVYASAASNPKISKTCVNRDATVVTVLLRGVGKVIF